MLNSKGPFVEFSKTVMVALAVSSFMVMTMSLFRICRVEFPICSDTCKVTVIASPAIATLGLNVTIDHSIPGVENLNVASNNSNPKVAMAGDAITVTLQVSEQIGNSTLQILNNDIVMTINDDTASATITVLENSTNGPFEFSITVLIKLETYST